MGDKKVQWTRTKVHESTHIDAGKGIPESVSKSLRLNQLKQFHKIQSNRTKSSKSDLGGTGRESVRRTGDFNLRLSNNASPKSYISELSELLEIEEYAFPDDDEMKNDPTKLDAKLDVTALDRYNEDVRRIRKLNIDECRLLPHKGDADENSLGRVKLVVRSLCRTVFYGTHKAQVLAEGAVVLVVWLLNRRATPVPFKTSILQSFAEMIWTSEELKTSLYRCSGMRVIAKIMVTGLHRKSELARWACYTLVIACIGSAEITESVAGLAHFEEAVGEIAFYAYWSNWPANFGSILQGILYGPHSVAQMEDSCDFI